MGLVVVDELDGFALSWSRQPESDFDALKDRGIATVADRFDIGFHTIEPNSRIPRPALNQQHAAGGNAGQESLGRSDLLAPSPQVGGLVDHQLVIAYLVDGPARRRRTRGMNAVHHQFVSGHPNLSLRRRHASIAPRRGI